MKPVQYPPARTIVDKLREHFERHAELARRDAGTDVAAAPDNEAVATMVDAAFWASLRREEGFVPSISLAYLAPDDERRPLRLSRPLPLTPEALTRLSPAVERPGIHLGVWPHDGELAVWGTTRLLPPYCFVVEVAGPGLLVVKHRRREESGKFLNVAVLEGDQAKLLDREAAGLPDCPAMVKLLLGAGGSSPTEVANTLAAIALSMRQHGHGGSLLVVPSDSDAWRESIRQPIPYVVEPPLAELSALIEQDAAEKDNPRWQDAFRRAVDAIAGLTAVDGATIMTDRYALLAFGAKIGRPDRAARVEQVLVTEPVQDCAPVRMHLSQLGGTRHQSAAQFVQDQHDAVALVASQDRQFTVFAWSACEDIVHAHRVEALLL
jgi:hypothetical protein